MNRDFMQEHVEQRKETQRQLLAISKTLPRFEIHPPETSVETSLRLIRSKIGRDEQGQVYDGLCHLINRFEQTGQLVPPETSLWDYVLLARAALSYHEQTHNLKMLNSALKFNDLLCQRWREELTDRVAIFTWVAIEQELRLLRQLIDSQNRAGLQNLSGLNDPLRTSAQTRLPDIALLATPTQRSRIYLQMLARAGLLPAQVLYLDDISAPVLAEEHPEKVEGIELNTPVLTLLERYQLSYQHLATGDPNAPEVVRAVCDCPQSIIVYGASGVVLDTEVLGQGKRFLHVHNGLVPAYRGKSAIYYSLLNEGMCGATAFWMDEQIDTGPVIRQRTFPSPADRTMIDRFYDPFIRAQLLVKVLQEYRQTGTLTAKPQLDRNDNDRYFAIHPLLKAIAMSAEL